MIFWWLEESCRRYIVGYLRSIRCLPDDNIVIRLGHYDDRREGQT